MAAEYDYRAVYLKSKYCHCYANVTSAGSRPARASAARIRLREAEPADQAISHDISK
jgi:hypothetical protein